MYIDVTGKYFKLAGSQDCLNLFLGMEDRDPMEVNSKSIASLTGGSAKPVRLRNRIASATCVSDFRLIAEQRLPRLLFDYIDGGSYSEETMRRNVADFSHITLEQRVMRDVSSVDTSIDLLGQSMAMPIVLSPVGLAGMYARRGEVQAARAASEAGVPFCLSSVSICGIEEVARAGGTANWFQIYLIKDRGYMAELLQRVDRASCPVLVFTVDVPVSVARLRDTRTGLAGEPGSRQFLRRALDGLTHPSWLWDVWVQGRPHSFGNFAPGIPEADRIDDFWGWSSRNLQTGITWSDLEWLREHWPRPIVLKGIMNPEDARLAVGAGADAIIVSNHGGRQLDGACSSIAALPLVVDAVAGRIPVLMDSGVRSGGDVLKALSLGASACLIGRAWAYALAAGGQEGVARMLDLFQNELKAAMALSGRTTLRERPGFPQTAFSTSPIASPARPA